MDDSKKAFRDIISVAQDANATNRLGDIIKLAQEQLESKKPKDGELFALLKRVRADPGFQANASASLFMAIDKAYEKYR